MTSAPAGASRQTGTDYTDACMRRLLAECEANDRLRAEDPAAFEAKMRAELPTSKCTLCGESFKGYGHNASPVRDEGVACDECNAAIVVPQRLIKWC